MNRWVAKPCYIKKYFRIVIIWLYNSLQRNIDLTNCVYYTGFHCIIYFLWTKFIFGFCISLCSNNAFYQITERFVRQFKFLNLWMHRIGTWWQINVTSVPSVNAQSVIEIMAPKMAVNTMKRNAILDVHALICSDWRKEVCRLIEVIILHMWAENNRKC